MRTRHTGRATGWCAARVAAAWAAALVAPAARADRLERLISLAEHRAARDGSAGGAVSPERKGVTPAPPAPPPGQPPLAAAPSCKRKESARLAPVACKKLRETGWNHRCEVVYPDLGTQGLVGAGWGPLDLSFDFGAQATVTGLFVDVEKQVVVYAGLSLAGPWTERTAVGSAGESFFPQAFETRYLRLLWRRSPRLPRKAGVHAAALGCGGRAAEPDAPGGETRAPTQWTGPTKPQGPLPQISEATYLPPEFWESDPQVAVQREDRARVQVPHPQPGTPPEESVLAQVEKAAIAEQQDMCSVWPHNDGCIMFRGTDKAHPIWSITAGSPKEGLALRKAREEGDVLAERLAWKLVLRDEPLVLAAMGSSTSAGHDTLFNSTYSLAVGRRLRRTFAQFNVDVQVRNQAMGGYDYRDGPMWCMEQIAGADADLVTWEWGMFGPEPCSLEVYARNAMGLPRRPVTLLLPWFGNGAPGGSHGGGQGLPRAWKEAAQLASPFGGPQLARQLPNCGSGGALGALEAALRDNECFERESARLGGMPFAVWEKRFAAAIAPIQRPGPELTVREYATGVALHRHYHEHGHGVYSWIGYVSDSIDWRPWWLYRHRAFRVHHHAGWLAHTLAGHALAHFVLDRLLAAVRRVRADLAAAGSMKALHRVYTERRAVFRAKELPPPLECARAAEAAPGQPRARCWTDYVPIEDSAAALSSLIQSADNNTWAVRTLGVHQYVPEGRPYRDAKLLQRGQAWWEPADGGPPEAGWLRLSIPPAPHAQEIALCFGVKYLRSQKGSARCRGNETLIAVGEYTESGYENSPAGIPLSKLSLPARGRFVNVRRGLGDVFMHRRMVALSGPDGGPARPALTPVYSCYTVCSSVPSEPTVIELRPEPVLSLTHVLAN